MRWCGSVLKRVGSFFKASQTAWKGVLQQAYLEAMQARLRIEDQSSTPSDMRGVTTRNLRELRAAIARALPKTKDEDTRTHLMDAQATIDRILTPPAVTATGTGLGH